MRTGLLWSDLPSGDWPRLPGHVCRGRKGASSGAWGGRGRDAKACGGELGLRFAGNDRGRGASVRGPWEFGGEAGQTCHPKRQQEAEEEAKVTG